MSAEDQTAYVPQTCTRCGRELRRDERLGWLDVMGRTNCPDDPAWRLHTTKAGLCCIDCGFAMHGEPVEGWRCMDCGPSDAALAAAHNRDGSQS